MEVRHRQHLALARCEPGFLGPRLAQGTMPVAAGVIDVARRAAGLAGLDMTAEHGCAAGEDGAPGFGFDDRQIMRFEIGWAVTAQHLGQSQARDEGNHVDRSARRRVEQFQRGSGTGQTRARQMQIAHGGRDVAVAQEALNGGQVHAGFEQVGGETVSQSVDAAFTGDAGGVAGGSVGALCRRRINRCRAGGIGKQPRAWAPIAPVAAQPCRASAGRAACSDLERLCPGAP